MPITYPIKNLSCVKESQAQRKEIIGVEEEQKPGEQGYKKTNAEYMKAYRLVKKAQKQLQQPDIKTPAAYILQISFRNKILVMLY